MADPAYTFPDSDMGPAESAISLNHPVNSLHGRSYSASINSVATPASQGSSSRMLEELGMRGLGDMSFNIGQNER